MKCIDGNTLPAYQVAVSNLQCLGLRYGPVAGLLAKRGKPRQRVPHAKSPYELVFDPGSRLRQVLCPSSPRRHCVASECSYVLLSRSRQELQQMSPRRTGIWNYVLTCIQYMRVYIHLSPLGLEKPPPQTLSTLRFRSLERV